MPLYSQSQHKCATDYITKEYAQHSDSYRQGLNEMNLLAERFENGLVETTDRSVKKIVIPVVVHVIYREEEDNISMEQIHSQIEVLNRDFNWQQSDKAKIPEIWRNLGAESGFEFRLADRDPDGNFTNGVTRRKTDVENIANVDNVDSDVKYYRTSRGGTDPWYQPHYLNIWVCEIGDRVLGYTYLPSANSVEPNDGIVIEPRAFGTTGVVSEPYTGGRTLVHEMGHYFGLRHPWGSEEGQCTNTDYMSDTPWQREANFNCSTFPHISCPAEKDGDMFMNFMDYANDTCSLLFTKKQVEYMQLVARTAKVTLIHSDGVTGVNQPLPSPLHIYPNPSDGDFNIINKRLQKTTYTVYNTLGVTVCQGEITSGNGRLDLSNHPAGMYFLQTELQTVPLVLMN